MELEVLCITAKLFAILGVGWIKGRRRSLWLTLARNRLQPMVDLNLCNRMFLVARRSEWLVIQEGERLRPSRVAAALREHFFKSLSIERLHSPKAPPISGVTPSL